ncbi:hypothetical protein KP509_15G010200 [Ceratopteris richardii]|uniref:Uncharacterized protein n=1 Tax=Ceratopteris richardii TaxID=49495 RepID=A0A8T2T5L7_CERRI|nr:hypothetical protein KP509_15G010200 [Ceratopteris richardii]
MEKDLHAMLDKLGALEGMVEETNTLKGITETLAEHSKKGFQEVNRRIGGVEWRGDELEKKLENLEGRRCQELGLVEKFVEIEQKHKDGYKELERKHMMLREKIERLSKLFERIEMLFKKMKRGLRRWN